MERDPWWRRFAEPDAPPLPAWPGPIGVKIDGGGSVRGQGRVGPMAVWRAVHNQNAEEIVRLVDAGHDVNEVEAAGNTPLLAAAWAGWADGVRLLLQLGAKVDASNNAGDRAWHMATRMGHGDVAALLEQNGASKDKGQVLVQEHVPKVRDFFDKPCWAHHPPPYEDFVKVKARERAEQEEARKSALRV